MRPQKKSQYKILEESLGVLLAVLLTPRDNYSLPFLGTADVGLDSIFEMVLPNSQCLIDEQLLP